MPALAHESTEERFKAVFGTSRALSEPPLPPTIDNVSFLTDGRTLDFMARRGDSRDFNEALLWATSIQDGMVVTTFQSSANSWRHDARQTLRLLAQALCDGVQHYDPNHGIFDECMEATSDQDMFICFPPLRGSRSYVRLISGDRILERLYLNAEAFRRAPVQTCATLIEALKHGCPQLKS